MKTFQQFVLLLGLILYPALSAAEGDFSITGEALITAHPDRLSGELRLSSNGTQNLHQLEISVVQAIDRDVIHSVSILGNGEEIRIPLKLEKEHAFPGRYHLLIETQFKDKANRPSSFNLYFPYTFGEAGGRPDSPPLSIEGKHLQWGDSETAGTMLGLALTTGPFWQVESPAGPGDSSFELTPKSGLQALPDTNFPQLAVLDWLGEDGYHYSRVFPWEIRTDSKGAWVTSPKEARLWRPMGPATLLLLGSLIALCAAVALALRQDRTQQPDNLVGYCAVLALTIWLGYYTHLELWFLDTWPTGGDLASHILYADRFQDWLFQGRITGWMHEVFAGYPAFRFYFPLPFILISLVSLLAPLTVAIKLVAMSPAILIPLAVYWMGGRFRWPVLGRLLASLFSVAFVIHDGSTVWGGNLYAQMSGEFAYSWGMLFALLFWGALFQALSQGGRAWVWPCLLEVLLGLSHGHTLLVAGFSALLMPLFFAQRRLALLTVLKVHLVAFLLLGFWLLPLLEYMPLTIPNDTSEWAKNLNTYLPRSMLPLLAGLPFLLYSLSTSQSGQSGVRFMALTALLSAAAYTAGSYLGLADIRFFPFVHLCTAIALGAATGCFLYRWGPSAAIWISFLLMPLLLHYWLPGMDRIASWAHWNMEGYESKAMWPHYEALAKHLEGDISEPRVIFEHDPDNNDVGSTRALEALPLFGSRPVLEGLYMESAITGPFIYQMQAEISERPSSPLSRYPSVKGTSAKLADRLASFYTDTVVVRSKQSIAHLSDNPDFEKTGTFGPLTIFQLRTPPALVTPITQAIALPDSEDWLQTAFEHYILYPDKSGRVVYGLDASEVVPGRGSQGPAKVEVVDFKAQSLAFETDRPGSPHLIKVAYHPAWQALGGEKIYKAGPAFMMVIPDKNRVELHFGKTPGQTLGLWLSVAGLLLLVIDPIRFAGLDSSTGRMSFFSTAGVISLTIVLIAYYHPSRAYALAHEFFAAAQFAKAATQFELALERRQVKAHRAEALFWSARSRQLANQPDLAIAHFSALVNENPASFWAPESLYRLAKIHGDRKEATQASTYSQRLINHYPGNPWSLRWHPDNSSNSSM